MIKANKGSVQMAGRTSELLGELFTILQSARENFGNELVDYAVEESKKSDEEIHKEAEEVKRKFVKGFIDRIFNGEEK